MATKTITLGLDYSGFAGSINQCNQKLKLLDAEFEHSSQVLNENASAEEQAALKTDYLTQKIEIQKAKVEAAKQKYYALLDAHADTSKIDAADAALLRERTTLHQLENELNNGNMSMQQFMSVAAALVATLVAVGSAMIDCANSAAQYVDEVNTLSQQSGASTEMVQTWEGMADAVDVSVETMSGAMSRLKKSMDSAKDGSGNTASAFKQLGVSVKDSHGNLRSASDVMYEVFDALRDMSNETEKDALAMQIFGKSADQLAGAIDGGKDAYNEWNEKLRESGAILNGEAMSALQEYNDALDQARVNVEASKNAFGAVIAEALLPLVEAFNALPEPVRTVVVVLGLIVSTAAPAVAGLMALSVAITATGASAAAATAMMGEFVVVALAVAAACAAGAAIGLALAEAFETIASAFEQTDKSANILERMFQTLQKLREANPIMMGFAEAFISPLLVIEHAIENFIRIIQALIDKIKEIRQAWSGASESMSSVGANSVGHNASGSENWRGGLTWVGEEGPELVALPQGSRIYNNTDSRNMATTTNISMSLDLSRMKSVSDVIDAVQNLGVSMGGI